MTSEGSHKDNPDAAEKIDKPTQGRLFTDEESMGFLNPITNIEEKIAKLQQAAKCKKFIYTISEAAQLLEISQKALLRYRQQGMITESRNKGRVTLYYRHLIEFLREYSKIKPNDDLRHEEPK